MTRARWVIILFQVIALTLVAQGGLAKTLSKEEVDALWEGLLREERYWTIEYLNRKYSTPTTDAPTRDKKIIVIEGREGFLWGFFGLSEGGGWEIEGRLEAEVPIDEGLLQLYSKATTKWSPGFAWIVMPGYDPEKYPLWEFRLILRNPSDRREIHQLKSIHVPTREVIRPNPVGQRTPRGELRYEAARQVAVIQILGVHHPETVEVPILQSAAPAPRTQRWGRIKGSGKAPAKAG